MDVFLKKQIRLFLVYSGSKFDLTYREYKATIATTLPK